MGSGHYQIEFSDIAIEDLRYWKKSGQKNLLKKIEQLIQAISDDPLTGIGKPEPLKHALSGKYSRRINQEHRIIYRLDDDIVYILSLKGHY
ncbi:Txe/YoeB family addiction module toxin [Dyadobacter frigoris]|uniref:Putative mRNA interferase YoeB n=1 Tax=Dyadobacter frigoris TaxID=2576211 RepID=A0A4U6CY20_9BACT|nr:Txe/YoeB family addiction module toxin [Dyadobacter frigoris]TKT88745.1 Txe/YoeB family addiction module toxin [Dyadobacter frigoris]GLU53936.1 Txe/YoeB family addiction module toxin [Dyadobacter frigoris]